MTTPDDDKIRILWVEDQPELGSQSIGLGEFSEYFRVVGIRNSGRITSIRSIEEYDGLLARHFSVGNGRDSTEFLPVEIISADYDLSKFTPGSEKVGDRNLSAETDPESIRSGSSPRERNAERSFLAEDNVLRNSVDPGDYDGCIINMMHLSEFSDHPCGSVVTTYQEPSARHRCAKKLEEHLKRRHDIDLTFSGTRTWEAILCAGVKALKCRIRTLHKQGRVILLPSELMGLIEGKRGVLTLRSRHALRSLPVQGLFIDEKSDQSQAISLWALDLIEDTVGYDVYLRGKELAQAVWRAYRDSEWMQERRDVSKVLASYSNENLLGLIEELGKGQCSDSKLVEYWEKYRFEATQGRSGFRTTCNGNTCDFHSWGGKTFSKRSRRWAAILLVFWLFEHILKKRTELAKEYRELLNREYHEDYPHITQDDVYLALFPIPKTPLVLPWDKGDTINNDSTWAANLKRLKDDITGASLALSVEDVLNGHGWSESGPHGLMIGERCMLQGLCRESEVGEDAWRDFRAAARFIWGSRG